TFETTNTSWRRPAIAAPTSSSASPYISAVSTCAMPRSRPRRSVSTAAFRPADPTYHVPWPITGTSRPLAPNGRRSTAGSLRRPLGLRTRPLEHLDHRPIERRNVVGLPTRHEVAVDHDLLVHPLRTRVAEVGLEGRPCCDPPAPRRTGLD